MNYKNYIVEDFVTDESFRDFVLKRNPDAEQFWKAWIEKHPEKKPVIEEAKKIIRALDFNELKVSQQEIESGYQEISEFFDETFKKERRKVFLSTATKVAAPVLIVIIAGFGIYQFMNKAEEKHVAENTEDVSLETYGKKNEDAEKVVSNKTSASKEKEQNERKSITEEGEKVEKNSKNHEQKVQKNGAKTVSKDPTAKKAGKKYSDKTFYATDAGERQKILLPDGSEVYLNEQSKLTYTNSWENNKERIVQLSGEAYFNVKEEAYKGEKVKFKVNTGALSVEVVGTEFNVNQNKKKTKVSLHSGKIRMNIPDIHQTLEMNPGDIVEYNSATGDLQSIRTDQAQIVSWLGAFDAASIGISQPDNMTTEHIDKTSQTGNNESKIHQGGSENNAYIEQIGENLKSKQIQIGKSNKATAKVEGSREGKKDEFNYSIWQGQAGEGNVSLFRLMKSYNSNMYSLQIGKRNKVDLQSKGANNTGLILQYGKDNKVKIRQDGNRNKALILQGAHNNKSVNRQKGNNNKVKVDQQ